MGSSFFSDLDRIQTCNLLTTQNESGLFFEYLDSLNSNANVKGLLFINRPECLGEEVYDRFIKSINADQPNGHNIRTSFEIDKIRRFKEINILDRFVEYISNYNKLCFVVLSGSVVTPFFGLALATDIRYATSEMNFLLSHNNYGLHPSGGLPYFLIKELGYSKALEIMLSEKVSAKKALELGLISKIVPDDDFLDIVIEDIQKLTKHSNDTLRRTKQLSSYARGSMSDYFGYEASIINLR